MYHDLLNASAHDNVYSTSYVNASSNESHVPSHASYTNLYVIGLHCATYTTSHVTVAHVAGLHHANSYHVAAPITGSAGVHVQ